jgi:hypothetical protein
VYCRNHTYTIVWFHWSSLSFPLCYVGFVIGPVEFHLSFCFHTFFSVCSGLYPYLLSWYLLVTVFAFLIGSPESLLYSYIMNYFLNLCFLRPVYLFCMCPCLIYIKILYTCCAFCSFPPFKPFFWLYFWDISYSRKYTYLYHLYAIYCSTGFVCTTDCKWIYRWWMF